MNDKELLDIYTDYLISSFGLTTGTGLSRLLDGAISHDQIQRFLASPVKSGADLWQVVKPYVRQIESDEGVLIVDDSISEKPYTDENEIMCWHWDHSKNRSVKGINFITAMYHAQDVSLPIGYQLVEKTEFYIDKKTNLKVALSADDKKNGRYLRLDDLEIDPNTEMIIYLEGVDFSLKLIKQVFTNAYGSIGILYLVTSDIDLTYDEMTTIYGKRWNAEPYHNSLKQNVSLSKSPTKTVTTQSNHFFAALCGYIKLEMLKVSTKTNHFALKSKLYMKALRTALDALNDLQPIRLSA